MNGITRRMPFEAVAAFLAIGFASSVLGVTLGTARFVESYTARHTPPIPLPTPVQPISELAENGRHLFLQNCAHCHAPDATGDEGPNLHGVKKSDDRIRTIITKGIKGEMPKFGQKLNDGDVQSLIAYLHSLK